MKTFYLALDLRNDAELIAAYEEHHKHVWPEITEQMLKTGILQCEIFRVYNRMVMRLSTTDDFSFEQKAISDAGNPKVTEWETLMWQFQEAIPGTPPGTKWVLMQEIYNSGNLDLKPDNSN